MTVSGAVEKVEAHVASQPARVTPAQMVRQTIQAQSPAFAAVLPAGFDADRWSRLLLTAVKATPDLMACFETEQGQVSILLAAMQAASVGLEPSTPTQECWILPRRKNRVMEAQLSIGYRGYMKLARRSGSVLDITAEVVHENDDFEWWRDIDGPHFRWVPTDDDPGELSHVWCHVRLAGGGSLFKVLNKRQVEFHRDYSDSWKSDKSRPYSPWTKHTEAMWCKTVVRVLVPYMDLSAEVATALASDEAVLTITDDGVTPTFDLPELEEPTETRDYDPDDPERPM